MGIKVSTNPAYSRSAGIRDLHDDDDGRVAVEAAGHEGASSGAAGMARLVRARQCWSWVVLSRSRSSRTAPCWLSAYRVYSGRLPCRGGSQGAGAAGQYKWMRASLPSVCRWKSQGVCSSAARVVSPLPRKGFSGDASRDPLRTINTVGVKHDTTRKHSIRYTRTDSQRIRPVPQGYIQPHGGAALATRWQGLCRV